MFGVFGDGENEFIDEVLVAGFVVQKFEIGAIEVRFFHVIKHIVQINFRYFLNKSPFFVSRLVPLRFELFQLQNLRFFQEKYLAIDRFLLLGTLVVQVDGVCIHDGNHDRVNEVAGLFEDAVFLVEKAETGEYLQLLLVLQNVRVRIGQGVFYKFQIVSQRLLICYG